MAMPGTGDQHCPCHLMARTIFQPEHNDFRESARAFIAREAVPHTEEWERAGMVDRSFWRHAAKLGFVGFEAPEQHGGAGIRDFRFNAILDEEMAYASAVGDNFSLQNDIVCPYLVDLGTDDQHARWLPRFTTGELIVAIAMSEPSMGSDLRAMTATARTDGDRWIINGSKTFVTSGIQADLVITAVKMADGPHAGAISLFVVNASSDGFTRGRKLRKIGRLAQDTAELFYDDVVVTRDDLLGVEGDGLGQLKTHLAQERMSMAVMATAVAERALELTVDYASERVVFGTKVGSHQGNRFALAELRTEVDVARVYLDDCIRRHVEETLTAVEAAQAKLHTTELQWRVLDRCLQLFGGYGYMEEYEIARMWRDARVQRIYGGTSEIMKEIVGRSMGL
jgi:acyl-CoA dehydrogenase